jgi:hypothetical protein
VDQLIAYKRRHARLPSGENATALASLEWPSSEPGAVPVTDGGGDGDDDGIFCYCEGKDAENKTLFHVIVRLKSTHTRHATHTMSQRADTPIVEN